MDAPPTRFLVMAAALVIVLAGLKSASVIVVPFLLSLVLAIILSPLFEWLVGKKVPPAAAVLAVMFLFIAVVGGVGAMAGSSVQEFSANLSGYEAKFETLFSETTARLESWGVLLPERELTAVFDPKAVMRYSAILLKNIGSLLADGMVILFTVIFMLLEAAQFRDKIRRIDASTEGYAHFENAVGQIKHYMALKALISAGTGICVTLFLMVVGVDYAVLWGVVAFLLNFIPNIGSIIAALPAVLLALIQLGTVSALVVAGGYAAINILIGSVLEPRIIGRGLGLSTLVVFLSLIFWGWLLGPVGMLLSIPLTIMAKILLESQPNSRWMGIVLGQ